jgi:hypothetical protein
LELRGTTDSSDTCNILTLGLLFAWMIDVSKAASAMGRHSAETRAKKWGKQEFRRRMREWGKLGGRPKGSGEKAKAKRKEGNQ